MGVCGEGSVDLWQGITIIATGEELPLSMSYVVLRTYIVHHVLRS